jgi:hypothetical protein
LFILMSSQAIFSLRFLMNELGALVRSFTGNLGASFQDLSRHGRDDTA